MRLIRHPQVIQDLVEIADFIAQDSLEASDRFIVATEETFAQLLRMPFYKTSSTEVTILRVLHGARDIEALFEDE